MYIAIWILLGGTLGFILQLLTQDEERGGRIGYVFLGVFGAILGGFTAISLGVTGEGASLATSLVFSLAGSTTLLLLSKTFQSNIRSFEKI